MSQKPDRAVIDVNVSVDLVASQCHLQPEKWPRKSPMQTRNRPGLHTAQCTTSFGTICWVLSNNLLSIMPLTSGDLRSRLSSTSSMYNKHLGVIYLAHPVQSVKIITKHIVPTIQRQRYERTPDKFQYSRIKPALWGDLLELAWGASDLV